MKRARAGIRKYRHKLTLCSQQDVVDENGTMRLNREEIRTVRAMIQPKKASTFSAQGAAHGESRNTRTHVVNIRYTPELQISTYAWLYEERRKSAPRWFKVLSVVETEDAGSTDFIFDCRLVERGDDIVPPVPEPDSANKYDPVVGLPDGVRF